MSVVGLWANHRCPSCGGVAYGPVNGLACEAGHLTVRMLPDGVQTTPEGKVTWCDHDAPERAKTKGVMACVQPPGHGDQHVWCGQSGAGLWFYGESGKVLVHVDLRDSTPVTHEEAAALWQFIDYRSKRAAAERAAAAPEAGP